MAGFVYIPALFLIESVFSYVIDHVTKQGNNQPSPSLDQHLYHWNLNVQVIVLEKASVWSLKNTIFHSKLSRKWQK